MMLLIKGQSKGDQSNPSTKQPENSTLSGDLTTKIATSTMSHADDQPATQQSSSSVTTAPAEGSSVAPAGRAATSTVRFDVAPPPARVDVASTTIRFDAPAIAEARIDAAARNDVLGLVAEPRADERISLPLIEIGPRALVF